MVASSGDRVSFDQPNPLEKLVGGSPGPNGAVQIPGLTHSGVHISEASAAALLQMAKEDPALYGRIVQHLNGLDPGRDWTLNLSPFVRGNTTPEQEKNFRAQLEKSLSANGLGKGGEHTSYFKGVVQYESVEKSKTVKEPTPGNGDAVKAMQADIQRWNAELASSFAFENDVGDRVKNPAESGAALDELIKTLERHQKVLEGATVELGGYTSTPGTDAHNLGLSDERAATIRAMLASKLEGTGFEERVLLTSAGYGEAKPVDRTGQPVALDRDGRPMTPELEDQAKSRRVELNVTLDPLRVEGQPGEKLTWREAAGVVLEIKAKPESSSGGHSKRPNSNVSKSPISKRIGGEIPCPKWMKGLLGH